ncbi:MAG: hypothetical protein EOO40_03300 [Deltaproteobacteria bacterium]|nr:MAG: hypothetical protein EOO40_03300 [Deltaproteobacteria bacterium]
MAQDKAAAPPRSHKPRDAEKLMFELGAHESIGGVTKLAESLLGRLRALDFHCYEAMPAAEAVPHLLRGPVSDALKAANEAMRLVRSLPRLVGAEPVAWDADDSRSEADAQGGLGVSEGRPAPYTPGVTAAVNVALEAALQAAKGPAQLGAVATRAQLEEFAVL